MNSKQKLAQALKEANSPGYLINRALSGYYSDYDSDLETPCVQLVNDLTSLGLIELASRAKEGEFDATKEESDEWYEREGKAIVKEMGIDPKKMGME